MISTIGCRIRVRTFRTWKHERNRASTCGQAAFNDGLVTASTKLHLVMEGKILRGNALIKKYDKRRAVARGQMTMDHYAASDS